MNSLYSLGVRQTSSLNNDLDLMANSAETSASLQGQIAASLAALSRTIEDYDSLARKEMIAAKQEKALAYVQILRVVKFREDLKRIRERFATLKKEKAAEAASSARTTLLGDPSSQSSAPSTSRLRSSVSTQSANSSSLIPPSSPTHESPFSFRPNNPRPNQPHYQAPDRMSHALREDTFANQAENQLDVLIAQGREVLGSLVEQRSWLKGTRKRLLDAANGVKGGREVVGWVERRSKQDTVIFFIGATITLVSFALIWWYLG